MKISDFRNSLTQPRTQPIKGGVAGLGISSPDIACLAANIVTFVVVQCCFFYLIASRQYEKLVQDKLAIMKPFLKDDRLGKHNICKKFFETTNNVKAWESVVTPENGINIINYDPSTNDVKNDIKEDMTTTKETLTAELEKNSALLKKAESLTEQLKNVEDAEKTKEQITQLEPVVQNLKKKRADLNFKLKEISEGLQQDWVSIWDETQGTIIAQTKTNLLDLQEYNRSPSQSLQLGKPKYMPNNTYLRDISTGDILKPLFANDELQERAKEDEKHNLKCLKTWARPFVVGGIGLLVVSVATALGPAILSKGTNKWKKVHSLGLVLVAACFSTELLYFFGVFRTYQVLGDWDLIERLLSHMLPSDLK